MSLSRMPPLHAASASVVALLLCVGAAACASPHHESNDLDSAVRSFCPEKGSSDIIVIAQPDPSAAKGTYIEVQTGELPQHTARFGFTPNHLIISPGPLACTCALRTQRGEIVERVLQCKA
jgi:hypothetical protein